jgi:LPS sulfotransferase NodH
MKNCTPFRSIVILGAGRSGTNILRDCLTELQEFATWPCDEIQPIWRYRNGHHPNDELPTILATPKVINYINGAFNSIWSKSGKPDFVVEKTCANTLRVPFIEAVLDEPFYIHLVRHGSGVVPSAVKRWRGELEVPNFAYFAAKARYIPVFDIPSYLLGFVAKRVNKVMGRVQHLSSWGPRFEGLDAQANEDIDVICAQQWVACVNKAQDALVDIDPMRWITIYYEDFVSDPGAEIMRVLDALNVKHTHENIADAVKSVRRKQTNKNGKAIVNPKVANIITPTLQRLGYGVKK